MVNSELIKYKPENETKAIEVRIEDDTVWLTQAQMAELFETTRNNITLHISNIFKEQELQEISVCKDSLHTASDGKKYKVKIYNLDVIISVGYRVKSKRGTQFRIWANQVLKEYLLKGYAIKQRFESIEKKIYEHDLKFDMLIKANVTSSEGIFFDGQVFDAYTFIANIIKSARSSIILIDNYIDESILLLLSKRNNGVTATIFTDSISKELNLDIKKFNKQYSPIEIREFKKSHDRFLIIDESGVYHIGASLKDLGKKWFAFSKIKIDALQLIEKL